MAVDFGIVLGFDAMGAVRRTIPFLKACSLTPFVVLNERGADYSDLLPEGLVLRSKNVNHNHAALIDEIKTRLDIYSNGAPHRVSRIVNFQDWMWMCYLDLCREFPDAASLPTDLVERTSIKPNLRFLTRGTPWEVRYALVSADILDGPSPLAFPPLRALIDSRVDLVVKPAVGVMSKGVKRVEHSAVERGLARVIADVVRTQMSMYSEEIECHFLELDPGGYCPVSRMVLIEEYLDGTEYSVEGVADDAGVPTCLLVQEKTIQDEGLVFRDLERTALYPVPGGSHAKEIVGDLLRIVGFKSSPFHIEIKRFYDEDVKPVEFNPRMGGGSIMDLMAVAHGIDVQGSALARLAGRAAGPRCFVTAVRQPANGEVGRVVKSYGRLKEIEKEVDCVFVRKIVAEGTRIEGSDQEVYLFEICIVGPDVDAARRRAAELLGAVTIDLE